MGAKQSAEVGKALQLVAAGGKPHTVAALLKLAPSTVYRALQRQRDRKPAKGKARG